MSILFQPVRIGNIELKNRFVRSATGERLVEKDGSVTDDLVKIYEALAKGEIGTIITGHSFIREDGRSGWQMMGIHNDNMIRGLYRLPKAVHQYDARIFVQLNHTGRYAPGAIIGTNPLAPSIIEKPVGMYPPKEMSETDITEIIRAFGGAAERAREAGFDGVQIHAAHGYLLSQFLSPHANRRTDEWGGTAEKRARILLEVYKNIRSRLGDNFPVWIKMNCEDFIEGGLSLDDSLLTAGLLEKEGVYPVRDSLSNGTSNIKSIDGASTQVSNGANAIEISGGVEFYKVIRKDIGKEEQEAYCLPQAERFRAKLKLPLILVGGIRSVETMEMLVKDKGIDLISMCRPFIREPDFAAKIYKKLLSKSSCVSCNACLTSRKNEPIKCRADKRD